MRKIIVIVLFEGIVLMTFTSPAFAGGDQNTGGTGTGKGSQKTYENGCGSQPCSSEVPRPQNEYHGEYVLEKP